MRRTIQHDSPVWREAADFLVYCALDNHGVAGWSEQIWTKRVEAAYHQICCIPFFTYGLALGDVIEVEENSAGHFVTGLLRSNGHVTVRILANDKNESGAHETLHDVVVPLGLLAEWQAPAYVAIDAPDSEALERIQGAAAHLVASGSFTLELTGSGAGIAFPD